VRNLPKIKLKQKLLITGLQTRWQLYSLDDVNQSFFFALFRDGVTTCVLKDGFVAVFVTVELELLPANTFVQVSARLLVLRRLAQQHHTFTLEWHHVESDHQHKHNVHKPPYPYVDVSPDDVVVKGVLVVYVHHAAVVAAVAVEVSECTFVGLREI
jgi:hypothetical protein